MENLLTTQEAAAHLRIHPLTLQRWARQGIIPASRVGLRRLYRFKQSDLDAYLSEGKVKLGGS